ATFARWPWLASASPIILLAGARSLRVRPGFFRMSLRIVAAPPGRFVHSAFCARSTLFAHGLAAFCASLLGRGGSGCADATSLDGAAGEGAGTGSAAADGGMGDSAAAGGRADAPAF